MVYLLNYILERGCCVVLDNGDEDTSVGCALGHCGDDIGPCAPDGHCPDPVPFPRALPEEEPYEEYIGGYGEWCIVPEGGLSLSMVLLWIHSSSVRCLGRDAASHCDWSSSSKCSIPYTPP